MLHLLLIRQQGEGPARVVMEREAGYQCRPNSLAVRPLLLDASADDDSAPRSTAVVCSPKYKLARFRLPPVPRLVPELSLSAALIGDLRVSGSCSCESGWPAWLVPAEQTARVSLRKCRPWLHQSGLVRFRTSTPELGDPQILLTARCVGPQHCCSHRCPPLLRVTWPFEPHHQQLSSPCPE